MYLPGGKIEEYVVLTEHILSFLFSWLTIFLSKNSNIQFLAFMATWQHLIKIVRIILYGFELKNAPMWFCIFHSFLNYFSHNSVIILSCFIIFNLYAAVKHPLYYAKYNKKVCPYVYFLTIIYIFFLIFGALFEPIFKPYSDEDIKNRHNCSSAYRYKLYQYLLTSPLNSILLIIYSFYCTIVIVYRLITTPNIKNQITVRTRIPLSRWISVLLVCIFIGIISFFNLYSDIKNGLNPGKEEENISIVYYITACSGILIFIFMVSPKQMLSLFGVKDKSKPHHHHHHSKHESSVNTESYTNSNIYSDSNSENYNTIKSYSSKSYSTKSLSVNDSKTNILKDQSSYINFNLPRDDVDDTQFTIDPKLLKSLNESKNSSLNNHYSNGKYSLSSSNSNSMYSSFDILQQSYSPTNDIFRSFTPSNSSMSDMMRNLPSPISPMSDKHRGYGSPTNPTNDIFRSYGSPISPINDLYRGRSPVSEFRSNSPSSDILRNFNSSYNDYKRSNKKYNTHSAPRSRSRSNSHSRSRSQSPYNNRMI